MRNNKKFTNCISIGLLVIFFLPITILAFHSFANHHHEICISKVESHIHDKDLDCNLHLYNQSNTYIQNFDYQILESTEISSIPELKNSFLKQHQQLSFSLRGPPASVLT